MCVGCGGEVSVYVCVGNVGFQFPWLKMQIKELFENGSLFYKKS